MQHAVAVVGVVAPVGRVEGIRPVADIQAVEVGGHLPDDGQVVEHILFAHGRVVARQGGNVMDGKLVEGHGGVSWVVPKFLARVKV
jgi:hypothetical protein